MAEAHAFYSDAAETHALRSDMARIQAEKHTSDGFGTEERSPREGTCV